MLLAMACRSTEPKYYLLSAGSPRAKLTAATTVGVGPVTFPDYLDRTDVVERTGPGELKLHSSHLWAESLTSSFASALAENLAGLLGNERVVSYPWDSVGAPTTIVEVRVLRFDGRRGADVVLRVAWTVQRNTGAEPMRKTSEYRERVEGQTIAALTQAMSLAVSRFSEDVGRAVAK